MYVFSNALHCKYCGGTNLYFFKQNKACGKNKKTWVIRICKECYLERQRKYNKAFYKNNKERFRLYRSNNIELIRKQWVKATKKYKAKQRQKKALQRLQDQMFGKELK